MNLRETVAELLAQPWPLPIVTAGHPVLRVSARPYEGELTDSMLSDLIQAMRETMYAAPGVGLAAPQIGLPIQLAVLEDSATLPPSVADAKQRFPLPFRTIINPSYRALGDGRATFYEGCLSVPGYQAVVDRPAAVELTCLDAKGNELTEEFTGWSARIVQHETDHLAGTLYLDKAFTRSLSSNEHVASRWAGPVDTARSALSF